jgi:hypothetical protein
MKMDSKMRGPKAIAAKITEELAAAAFAMPLAGRAIMTAFVMLALVVVPALGATAANAAEHSGEPSDLAHRSVSAMASPEVATLQMSTVVTGVLAASEAGSPGLHDLHFQNRVSGNLYVLRTEPNGAFSTMLPQGIYDLRGMHGAVIASAVMVGQSPVNLGQVRSPGPYNVWRLLEWQETGPVIVTSPAPATAYLPNLALGPQPIVVTPVISPRVMGAGPNGEALAPAEVMPTQEYEQTEIPAGADVPRPGVATPQEMSPAPGGGY